jgi:hypothetical protein
LPCSQHWHLVKTSHKKLEVPLKKTYLDENNKKIEDGFKLYTSYHLGYHIPLFKDRLYFEPQIHCNYWPIDTKGPQGFEEKERKWNNYFLFEPNLFFWCQFLKVSDPDHLSSYLTTNHISL